MPPLRIPSAQQHAEDFARVLTGLSLALSHASRYDEAHITNVIHALYLQNRHSFRNGTNVGNTVNAAMATISAATIIDRALPPGVPRPSNDQINNGINTLSQAAQTIDRSVQQVQSAFSFLVNPATPSLKPFRGSQSAHSANSIVSLQDLSNVAASFAQQTLVAFAPPPSSITVPSSQSAPETFGSDRNLTMTAHEHNVSAPSSRLSSSSHSDIDSNVSRREFNASETSQLSSPSKVYPPTATTVDRPQPPPLSSASSSSRSRQSSRGDFSVRGESRTSTSSSSSAASRSSFSPSFPPPLPDIAAGVRQAAQTAQSTLNQTNAGVQHAASILSSTAVQFLPKPSKFVPRERSVPSTPLGRLFGFGGIAARMVAGPIFDATKNMFSPSSSPSSTDTRTARSETKDSSSYSQPQSTASQSSTASDVNRTSPTSDSSSVKLSSSSPVATTLSQDADEQLQSNVNQINQTSSPASSSTITAASPQSRSAATTTATNAAPRRTGYLSHFMSEANTERLAEGLCRMRGAALKVGQMLSIQDDSLLPPQLRQVLDRVRDGADVMPRLQLERTMAHELGSDWLSKFQSFDFAPIAAASIGQVHKGELQGGEKVAIKVQYPGVAESIHSDVNNVRTLIRLFNVLPAGLYIDQTMQAAKEELSQECDYDRERQSQKRFKALVDADARLNNFWVVPAVYDSHSTRHVLTSELIVDGLPIDSLVSLDQSTRNDICRQLLRLCLTELFEWRFMQTDPNWSNFLYRPSGHRMALIDFGASREYAKSFVDAYLRMVHACAERDREGVVHYSQQMGFLTGDESATMVDAHIEAAFIVGEPFSQRYAAGYDFSATDMAARVSELAKVMVKHRLTAPPKDSYTLHRKLSGCFLTCKKLQANIPCRDLFSTVWDNYTFDEANQADSQQQLSSTGRTPVQ